MREKAEAVLAVLDETRLHLKYCAGWGLSEADVVAVPEGVGTVSYTRWVLDRGLHGDILDLEIALAPCTWAMARWRCACWPTRRGRWRAILPVLDRYLCDDGYQPWRGRRGADRRAGREPWRGGALREADRGFREAARLEQRFWQQGWTRRACRRVRGERWLGATPRRGGCGDEGARRHVRWRGFLRGRRPAGEQAMRWWERRCSSTPTAPRSGRRAPAAPGRTSMMRGTWPTGSASRITCWTASMCSAAGDREFRRQLCRRRNAGALHPLQPTVKFRDLVALAATWAARRWHRALRAGAWKGRRGRSCTAPPTRRATSPISSPRRRANSSSSRVSAGRVSRQGGGARGGERMGLAVAEKPDSQDICFVPGGRYDSLVAKLRPDAAARASWCTRMAGCSDHAGIGRFTVGQGRGLGNASWDGGERLYVRGVDAARRRVVLGPAGLGAQRGGDRRGELADPEPAAPLRCAVKLRAREAPRPAWCCGMRRRGRRCCGWRRPESSPPGRPA